MVDFLFVNVSRVRWEHNSHHMVTPRLLASSLQDPACIVAMLRVRAAVSLLGNGLGPAYPCQLSPAACFASSAGPASQGDAAPPAQGPLKGIKVTMGGGEGSEKQCLLEKESSIMAAVGSSNFGGDGPENPGAQGSMTFPWLPAEGYSSSSSSGTGRKQKHRTNWHPHRLGPPKTGP